MAEIIQFQISEDQPINTASVQHSCRKLKAGLIAPATEDTSYEIAGEHTAEPIKNIEDIYRISQFLIGQKRYRDNMLFIVGINFGLRVSDLLTLRFSHIINIDSTGTSSFKDTFAILEKKTKDTRKKKRNRYVTINTAVAEAVTLYLENTPEVKLSDYMFRSESNRGSNKNAPIHRNSVDRIIRGIGQDLNLNIHMSTHTLRKTFGFHQMLMSNNDPRKLLLLQKIFGHSSSAITLDYIGITKDEICDAYRNLNLGSHSGCYLVDSTLHEGEYATA